MLDKESRNKLQKECIDVLKEAQRVLNINIREIKENTKDLQDKGVEMEDTYKSDFDKNQHIIPDFDVISPNLIDSMKQGMQEINDFFNRLDQYKMFINPKFEEYKRMKIDKLESLSKED